MADEINRLANLVNKRVPDNPGALPPAPPPAEPPPGEGSEATDSVEYGASDAPERPDRLPTAVPERPKGPGPGAEAEAEAGFPMAEIARDFEKLAERMNQDAANLRAAGAAVAGERHEFADRDGSIRITLDGGARVTDLHISAKAMRSGPDALSAALVELVDRAVRETRGSGRELLLQNADPTMRGVLEDAMSTADRVALRADDEIAAREEHR